MIVYLFDIDGTLVSAPPQASGRVAFDAVFYDRHAIAHASSGIRFGGKTDYAIIDEIYRARLGRSATRGEAEQFVAAYLPRLSALLAEHGVIVLPGVVEALAYLSERPDVLLGIATGNVRAGASAKLGAGHLERWFALDRAASPVGDGERGGTAPTLGGYGCDSQIRSELVARAIERARQQCTPCEIIVVGDTIHDIAAARACGATVVAVATGTDSAEALHAADAVLATMSELPAWHAARFGAI